MKSHYGGVCNMNKLLTAMFRSPIQTQVDFIWYNKALLSEQNTTVRCLFLQFDLWF